jgi:hypothetical protein
MARVLHPAELSDVEPSVEVSEQGGSRSEDQTWVDDGFETGFGLATDPEDPIEDDDVWDDDDDDFEDVDDDDDEDDDDLDEFDDGF